MPSEFQPIGKALVLMGLALVAIGLLLWLGPKVPILGRLPGDLIYKSKGFTFYFPLATSILISIILSLLFFLFGGRR